MFGVPLLLILGFAGFIFVSFMNDDADAKGLFTVALIVMALGAALIIAHFVGSWVSFN